jgi:hypothetical protein
MGFLDSKSEKERKKIAAREKNGDQFVVVSLAKAPMQTGGSVSGDWSTIDEGVDLMNELAAAGWRIVAALAYGVIMERPAKAA